MVEVNALIERAPVGQHQLLTVALVSLAVIVDGFDIQAIAFAGPVLLEEWGLTKAELGTAIAAALIGMAIGAPIGGAVGDRIGRRTAVIASVAFFSVMTLAAAAAQSMTQLALLRLAGGLGFGAMLPNAMALVAEWMPARARGYAVSIMSIGVPVGGMLAAALSSWLIADYGWRACFIAGGLLGVITTVLLFGLLPESLCFLARRKDRALKLGRLLASAFPMIHIDAGTSFELSEPPSQTGLHGIFAADQRRVTIGLALAFFANLAVTYAFFNWVPTMLVSLGMPIEAAIRGAFHFNLWGIAGAVIGAIVIARLGSRKGLLLIICGAIAVTATMAAMVLQGRVETVTMIAGLGFAGLFIAGGQACFYTLATIAYPTSCRSSGVGFAAGVGRLGAISSALGGATVLALPGGVGWFFILVTILLMIAGCGVLLVNRHSDPSATRRPADTNPGAERRGT